MSAAANQTGEHWMDRHGVNVGQGLKLPAVRYQATGAAPGQHQHHRYRREWDISMAQHVETITSPRPCYRAGKTERRARDRDLLNASARTLSRRRQRAPSTCLPNTRQ